MSTKAISLADVHLSLSSKAGLVHILRGVSFDVEQGEAIAIVGPSGSGKTSLLMVMSGLEPITAGRIEVAGRSLHGLSEAALSDLRRGSVAVIFQSFHLIPTLTAFENVTLPLEFRHMAGAEQIARDHLTSVGLGHRLQHYPGQLSGGEQQRVAIARATASGAKIILADEPTGNLDQDTGNAIMDLLFSLQRQHGVTLLLVTHDKALAERCDRIIALRDGLIVAPR